MKNIAFIGALAIGSSLISCNSKESTETIEKKVSIEEVNGEKHLTISTITNGDKIVEEFVGEEAEEKIKVLEKERLTHEAMVGYEDKKIDVRLEDKNGEKSLTIITTENGKEKIEVFEGDEVDPKLEEIKKENAEGIEKKVIVEKIVTK